MKFRRGLLAGCVLVSLVWLWANETAAFEVWANDVKDDVIYAPKGLGKGTALIYRGDARKDLVKNPGVEAFTNGLPPSNNLKDKLDIADHVNNDPKGHFLSFSYSAKSAAGWAQMTGKKVEGQHVYVLCAGSPMDKKIWQEYSQEKKTSTPVVVGIDAYRTLDKYKDYIPDNERNKLLNRSKASEEVLVEGHIPGKFVLEVCTDWDEKNEKLEGCKENPDSSVSAESCGK